MMTEDNPYIMLSENTPGKNTNKIPIINHIACFIQPQYDVYKKISFLAQLGLTQNLGATMYRKIEIICGTFLGSILIGFRKFLLHTIGPFEQFVTMQKAPKTISTDYQEVSKTISFVGT